MERLTLIPEALIIDLEAPDFTSDAIRQPPIVISDDGPKDDQTCPSEVIVVDDQEQTEVSSDLVSALGIPEEPCTYITVEEDEDYDLRMQAEWEDDFDDDAIVPSEPPILPEESAQSPPASRLELEEYIHKGYRYRPQMDVELLDGTFMRIKSMFYSDTEDGDVPRISGPRFRRCRDYMGYLPPKQNEVAMFKTLDVVSLYEVMRRRRIILTNAEFPGFRHVDTRSQLESENTCRLVCRWKVNIPGHPKDRSNIGCIERLRAEEVDEHYRVRDDDLRRAWRETHLRGFSDVPFQRTDMVDYFQTSSRKRRLSTIEDNFSPPPASRGEPSTENLDTPKYTFGDAFCGAGGTSSGAKRAGLRNLWGFDQDEDACKSYARNFPEAITNPYSVDTFLQIPEDHRVDVLHLSPPCQPHSPAHTIEGKNDEANEASGLCIENLLQNARPRVATLENTFGLLNRQAWFRSVIMGFTALGVGYSVRWKIMLCAQYGVPQPRRRLVVIASCPGERLPDFPTPVYSAVENCEPHLRPWKTLYQAIAGIPRGTSHHDPDSMPRFEFPRSDPPEWHKPFRRTLLAGGGHETDVHPCAVRKFTLRERARIQTFPDSHEFFGGLTSVRKQIGNAVPPEMAYYLMRNIRWSLQRADAAERAESSQPRPFPQVVDVDEDGDHQPVVFLSESAVPAGSGVIAAFRAISIQDDDGDDGGEDGHIVVD